tara:strand:- start:692 stop:1102 length:411 start_codon:yes stop_codon:yes gene_type:complete
MPQISNPTATEDLTDEVAAIDTVVDAIKAVTDNLPNSGALTNLDASVAGRLGAIAGIDRGSIALSQGQSSISATVSSVTTTRSLLNNLGWTVSSESLGRDDMWMKLVLANATTVTASRYGSDYAISLSYELVEYGS